MNLDKLGIVYKEAEIKDFDSTSRTISGYAAVFNNVDSVGDMLLRGCFAKSIEDRGPQSEAKQKILLLWQHETKNPIGKISELKEDEHGLYFEAVLDDVEEAERALRQLESGTLNQFSIGFSYVWDKCHYDTTGDVFVVGEVKLYEISVVSFGANAETEYLGLKSDDADNEVEKKITDFTKGLTNDKQHEFMKILSFVKSLSAAVPHEDAHESEEAEETERKSVFDCFV